LAPASFTSKIELITVGTKAIKKIAATKEINQSERIIFLTKQIINDKYTNK
jgi:hypothetical protein